MKQETRIRYSLPLARQEAQQLARVGYVCQIVAQANGSFVIVAERESSLNLWAESKDRR